MKYDYALLVNRGVAVTSCFIGVLEVLVGVFALICGFILLGGFCENVECGGITRGSGLFIGFPVCKNVRFSKLFPSVNFVKAE